MPARLLAAPSCRPPPRLPPPLARTQVYVCTYSEPVGIVEPTVVAALNMSWPGSKLTVCVLDDGRRPEMEQLVRRLRSQASQGGWLGGEPGCRALAGAAALAVLRLSPPAARRPPSSHPKPAAVPADGARSERGVRGAREG